MDFVRNLGLLGATLALMGSCHKAKSHEEAQPEDLFSLTPTEERVSKQLAQGQGGTRSIDLERLHRVIFPGWGQGLSDKYASYLQRTSRTTAALEREVFQLVAKRYYRAIQTYSETLTTTCRSKPIEGGGWITRLLDQFGRDNLKKDLAVLQRVIGATWARNGSACIAETRKELLAAESLYRVALFDRVKDLLQFMATLGKGERAALKQAETNLRALVSVHRKVSWASVVWSPREMQPLIKARRAPKRYVDFFSTDRSFQAPFAAFRAFKQLKGAL